MTRTTWQRPPWPTGLTWEYHPPPLSVCEPEDIFPLLQEGGEDIRVRLRNYEQRLVDFAVWHNVETALDGPKEVSRADCRHGHVHWHLFGRSGASLDWTSIRAIDRVEDIAEAYDAALDAVYERRADNRKRWDHG